MLRLAPSPAQTSKPCNLIRGSQLGISRVSGFKHCGSGHHIAHRQAVQGLGSDADTAISQVDSDGKRSTTGQLSWDGVCRVPFLTSVPGSEHVCRLFSTDFLKALDWEPSECPHDPLIPQDVLRALLFLETLIPCPEHCPAPRPTTTQRQTYSKLSVKFVCHQCGAQETGPQSCIISLPGQGQEIRVCV